MARGRRSPASDSAEGRLIAARNAGALHDWPEQAGPCSEDSWRIFAANQGFRGHDDWFEASLIELARLSRMMVAAVELQDRLDDEGYVIDTGSKVMENPAAKALNALNASITSLARRLGLTLNGNNDKQTVANRAKAQREAERDLANGEPDPFDRTLLM